MILQRINQERALTALNWDVEKIKARYMKEHAVNLETADIMEQELKRFLIVCAECSDGEIGMAGPIDDFWHTFIIFTHDYEKFCEQLNGKLIHHIPLNETDAEKPSKNELTAYQRFLSLYEQVFEEKPNIEIWPQESELAGCLSCQSCARCLTCMSRPC